MLLTLVSTLAAAPTLPALAVVGRLPVNAVFAAILGSEMPAELSYQSKRLPIVTARSSQPGSFLNLGPGASA